MSVIDAEYQWDGRKLTFFYSASHRIDFRDLVRELFRTTRPEFGCVLSIPLLMPLFRCLLRLSCLQVRHIKQPVPRLPRCNLPTAVITILPLPLSYKILTMNMEL
jgi:hypothetical protein